MLVLVYILMNMSHDNSVYNATHYRLNEWSLTSSSGGTFLIYNNVWTDSGTNPFPNPVRIRRSHP
jgi:hypothetical protein